MTDAFDYVIVGGGSAASVLALRLSQDPRVTVCVLEAGPADRNPFIRVPAGFVRTLFDPKVTWQFATEPSIGIGGRQIQITQGRTLGGSSSINGGIYNRGQAADFDHWAKLGNTGWSYADVLPYFRRSEHFADDSDSRYRGHDGPLHISTPQWTHPLCDAFAASAEQSGMPRNPDYNSEHQFGTGSYQAAIYRGRRCSAADAFLHPAGRNPNVDIRTKSLVCRVVLEGRRAVAVTYVRPDGKRSTVNALRGVIISAGAINTPKLLQLSGIGRGELLQANGIPVICDNPAVGGNLRDHFSPRLVYRVKGTDSINSRVRGLALGAQVGRWLLGHSSVVSIPPATNYGFDKTSPSLAFPDFSLVFAAASYKEGRVGILDDFPGMTCGVWQMRPNSSGYVRIRSSDVRDPPAFDPCYLTDPADQGILVAALKRAAAIFDTAPIRNFVEFRSLPKRTPANDEDWLEFARSHGSSSYHLAGSCPMGPACDDDAAVGTDLSVHGVERLHVIDSSVMPAMVSANTYATTLMIAEKGADLILGKTPHSEQQGDRRTTYACAPDRLFRGQ